MNNIVYKKYKTCIVCLAKNEEPYLHEFIDHYINKYKFDHVFIIDNNENDNRLNIDNILTSENDKILKESTTVIHYNNNSEVCNIERDYSGMYSLKQIKLYDEVILNDYHLNYLENNIKYNIKDNYDYCLVCDADEFLDIIDSKTKDIICINDFINNYMNKNNFTNVYIPWIIYSDNNMLKKDLNKSVHERFTIPTYKEVSNIWNIRNHIYEKEDKRNYFNWHKDELSWNKVLFSLNNIKHIDIHYVTYDDETYNKNNESDIKKFKISDYVDGKYEKTNDVAFYLKHYRTKSVEEYVEHKLMQANMANSNICVEINSTVIPYFYFNTINADKLIKFCSLYKKHNIKMTENDKQFILEQFNDQRFSPLTIIIRTNNRLEKLKECIKHIESQTMKANIIIGCDNCTDGTIQYLNDYISNDNKLSKHLSYFVSQHPLGPGRNTNILLNMVQTKFYMMIDDDDYYMYDKVIESIYNTIINNPDHLLYQFNPDNIKDKSFTWSHVYKILPTDYIVNSYKVVNESCNDDWYNVALCQSFDQFKNICNDEKYNICYIEILKEDLDENNEIDIYKYNICGELNSYNKSSVTYDTTYEYYYDIAKKNLLKDSNNYTDADIVNKSKKELDLIVDELQYKVEQSIYLSALKEYFMIFINNIPIQDRQYYYNKFLYM